LTLEYFSLDIEALSRLIKLKKLSIAGLLLKEPEIDNIINLLQKLPNLEELSLEQSQFQSDTKCEEVVNRLAKAICQHPRLMEFYEDSDTKLELKKSQLGMSGELFNAFELKKQCYLLQKHWEREGSSLKEKCVQVLLKNNLFVGNSPLLQHSFFTSPDVLNNELKMILEDNMKPVVHANIVRVISYIDWYFSNSNINFNHKLKEPFKEQLFNTFYEWLKESTRQPNEEITVSLFDMANNQAIGFPVNNTETLLQTIVVPQVMMRVNGDLKVISPQGESTFFIKDLLVDAPQRVLGKCKFEDIADDSGVALKLR
ncbi:MAG: hypothetical protein WBE18_01390, partial [Gammaproteobacteria bacterium]